MPAMRRNQRLGRRKFYLAVFALFAADCTRAHGDASPASSVDYESCAIDPAAIVSDACASFSTLDDLNTALQPSIKSLTRESDFFSYYRLNLFNKECPFWNDESGTCGNIACAVNTIENEEDIPEIWRAEELGKLKGPKARHPDRKLQQQTKPLLGELGADVGESCVVEYDDECDERDYCVPEDESALSKGDYVSLVDNPERFTGYSGPSAHQVWEAIYRENCFSSQSLDILAAGSNLFSPSPFGGLEPQKQAQQDLRQALGDTLDDDECLEKRVFYRVISGMHASISTHLCYDYLNQTTGQWGPNVSCFSTRLHQHPDRISNLYFNYALVLRALAKVRPALASYTFCSGDPLQDADTKRRVLQLADQVQGGPKIYDESLMFADASVQSAALKEDFKARFRNVSRTMDCVGCDKCRLWGKLQVAGYGTALKILFEFDESDPASNPQLRRTELVALVNTLDKLSHSLSAIGHFERMLNHDKRSSAGAANPSLQAPSKPQTSAEPRMEPLLAEGIYTAGEAERIEEEQSNAAKSELRQDFEDELSQVFHVMVWVFKRWLTLPGRMLKLVFAELGRLWRVYLGMPGAAQTRIEWEFHYPPARDEV